MLYLLNIRDVLDTNAAGHDSDSVFKYAIYRLETALLSRLFREFSHYASFDFTLVERDFLLEF